MFQLSKRHWTAETHIVIVCTVLCTCCKTTGLQAGLPMQVMRKNDLIRKNMVESVRNERNILAMANNPFVVRMSSNVWL